MVTKLDKILMKYYHAIDENRLLAKNISIPELDTIDEWYMTNPDKKYLYLFYQFLKQTECQGIYFNEVIWSYLYNILTIPEYEGFEAIIIKSYIDTLSELIGFKFDVDVAAEIVITTDIKNYINDYNDNNKNRRCIMTIKNSKAQVFNDFKDVIEYAISVLTVEE